MAMKITMRVFRACSGCDNEAGWAVANSAHERVGEGMSRVRWQATDVIEYILVICRPARYAAR